MVNKATAKAFSTAWYLKSAKHRVGELQNITQFFHPLDIVADWNRVYGPNGFLQYQFVVPFSEAETFKTVFRDDRATRATCRASTCSSASVPATPHRCRSRWKAGP